MTDLYYGGDPGANSRIDTAYDHGYAAGKRTVLTAFAFAFLVALLVGAMVFNAQPAHAQPTKMGAIATPQINTTLYVGQIGYPTIQSAVSAGCASSSPAMRVVIPAGTVVTDTIPAVSGCATVFLSDERNGLAASYVYVTGTGYVLIPYVPAAAGLVTAPATVEATNFSGSDLGAQLTLADAALLGPGIITVSKPSSIGTSPTMSNGRYVQLNSPITTSATINVGNSFTLRCNPGATITSSTPHLAILSDVAKSNLAVEDCVVTHTAPATAPMMVATGGAVSGISLVHNDMTGLALFASGATSIDSATKLSMTRNTITGSSALAAITVANATWGTFTDNVAKNSAALGEWWGGNSADFSIADGLTSHLTWTGGGCSVVGACIWGSKGADITVTGATADGCGDVCFDTEGGLRNAFANNTAKGCVTGCYAWFFNSRDITWTGNIAEATNSVGFVGKNSSGSVGQSGGISINANTVTCATVCPAFQSDATSDLHFDTNTLTNAIINGSLAGGSSTVSGNHLRFTVAMAANGVAIHAPAPQAGGVVTVEGNELSTAVVQPSTVTGIQANAFEYNYNTTAIVRSNRVFLNAGTGISTDTTKTNIGLRVFWTVEKNIILADTPIVHIAPSPANELYIQTADNRNYIGNVIPGATVGAVQTVAVGPTAATVGAQATAPLTWTAPPATIPGTMPVQCTVAGTAGVPAFVNTSAQTATGLTVTIQATTAAAASGSVTCQQLPY